MPDDGENEREHVGQDPQEKVALLATEEDAIISSDNTGTGGRQSATFLPLLALLLFGMGAGYLIGRFHGSLLWLVPVVAVIAGVSQRRIIHFKRYLLHSIIRTGEKQRV